MYDYAIVHVQFQADTYTAPWSDHAGAVKTVQVQPGVTSIGEYAFCDCTSLAEIIIPAGVTNIGAAAFYDCSGLREVILPDSVTDIDESAFQLYSEEENRFVPNPALVFSVPFGSYAEQYCLENGLAYTGR